MIKTPPANPTIQELTDYCAWLAKQLQYDEDRIQELEEKVNGS